MYRAQSLKPTACNPDAVLTTCYVNPQPPVRLALGMSGPCLLRQLKDVLANNSTSRKMETLNPKPERL